MRIALLLFLSILLFSCSEGEMDPIQDGPRRVIETEIVRDRSGRGYPFLDPNVISYCGPAWGRKFCHFLYKYDNTYWADTDNYYSDFSDIRFSIFEGGNPYFISFFNIDSVASQCDGWKIGETIHEGLKSNIRVKRDQDDVFWFDYDYYGTSENVEYTITNKYEVIDGVLHFSNSEGESFKFMPSERDYSEEGIETDEIIKLEGCLF